MMVTFVTLIVTMSKQKKIWNLIFFRLLHVHVEKNWEFLFFVLFVVVCHYGDLYMIDLISSRGLCQRKTHTLNQPNNISLFFLRFLIVWCDDDDDDSRVLSSTNHTHIKKRNETKQRGTINVNFFFYIQRIFIQKKKQMSLYLVDLDFFLFSLLSV